jgi:hypothetical protein
MPRHRQREKNITTNKNHRKTPHTLFQPIGGCADLIFYFTCLKQMQDEIDTSICV